MDAVDGFGMNSTTALFEQRQVFYLVRDLPPVLPRALMTVLPSQWALSPSVPADPKG